MTSRLPDWPDPRGKWPDFAKRILYQVILRGRPHAAESLQQQQQAASSAAPPPNNAASQRSSSSTQSQNQQQLQQQAALAHCGLAAASSDYNFHKPPSTAATRSAVAGSGANATVASVAALLTHAAQSLIGSRSTSAEVAMDESALAFLADLTEIACGPGGVAAVRVNFSSDDPGGVDFYKKAASALGQRVTYASSDRGLAGGGAASSTSSSLAVESQQLAQQQGAGESYQRPTSVATSTVVVANEMTVIDRCAPPPAPAPLGRSSGGAAAAASGGSLLLSLGSQNLGGASSGTTAGGGASSSSGAGGSTSSSAAGQRRARGAAADASAQVLYGCFSTNKACATCPSKLLQAVLCRRPSLHLLPCSALWLVFASLRRLLEQYDAVREQATQLIVTSSGVPTVIKPEPGSDEPVQERAPIDMLFPAGSLPPCLHLLVGEEQRQSWEWLWERVAAINAMLCDGQATYARIV